MALDMVAVTGDGSTLYTGDMQASTVSRLDVAAMRKTASFDVPTTPEAITVTRDGREVWVGSNDEQVVSVLDAMSGELALERGGRGAVARDDHHP